MIQEVCRMENMVEFKNITFQYDENTPVLTDFSFAIEKGKYTVLLGHNGSGKSTITKLIIGLLEAQKGDIYVNNLLLNEENIDAIRNQVAIVFQNPDNQFIGTTVEDDIAFGLENRNVKQSEMQGIIEKFAQKVNMQDFLKAEPSNLSGGQKQRVAIAGALALNPNLLILDEATSMLDPLGKKEIFSVIKEIRKENPNMSILSITHHIDEALQADEIVIINDGKITGRGKPVDLLYDGELLLKNALLPPFVINVTEALRKEGISIEKSLTIEDLVKKL